MMPNFNLKNDDIPKIDTTLDEKSKSGKEPEQKVFPQDNLDNKDQEDPYDIPAFLRIGKK